MHNITHFSLSNSKRLFYTICVHIVSCYTINQRSTVCRFIKDKSTKIDLGKGDELRCLDSAAAGDKHFAVITSRPKADDKDQNDIWISLYSRKFNHLGTLQSPDSTSNYFRVTAKVIEIAKMPPILIVMMPYWSIYAMAAGRLACIMATGECLDARLPMISSLLTCCLSHDCRLLLVAGIGREHGMCSIRQVMKIVTLV